MGPCSSRSTKLSEEQRTRLATDLKQPPYRPGCAKRYWTAALLMRHLRENYAATFSLRHCRRLLTIFETKRPAPTGTTRPRLSIRTTTDHQASMTVDRQEVFAPQRMGDYARKRQGLARIRRLASAGIPLQPFAYTLFDFVRDAVPYDEVSPGLVATSSDSPRWIVRDFNYERWFPHMQKYLLEAGPEISGFRPPSLLPLNRRLVLRHDEMVCSNYYRSEGYNEFFRFMGMHHGLLTLLRDEHGQFLGYYPVFRSERMRPFTAEDMEFFKAAAAYVALGVSTAALITWQSAEEDVFEPFERVPLGVVVMNRDGKVLSMNRAAQSLFLQFAIYDGWRTDLSRDGGLSAALCYIASQLRSIFGHREETSLEAGQPVVRIYSHCSGAILRLRGFVSDLGANHGHVTVLIELGETENLLRERLASCYQLSRRQVELLMLLRRGVGNKEIARRLCVSAPALKSSLRELRLKLDLSDLSSLREFARVIFS
jgi:DNA-binding CsgD family transcriptional regulator